MVVLLLWSVLRPTLPCGGKSNLRLPGGFAAVVSCQWLVVSDGAGFGVVRALGVDA
jgi:hypothetical protein